MTFYESIMLHVPLYRAAMGTRRMIIRGYHESDTELHIHEEYVFATWNGFLQR